MYFTQEKTLQTLRKRLITKEDPYHVHKLLGILALCSIIFRLSLMGPSDMGFETFPRWTLPTLLLHLALSLSSFEFQLPKKRISNGSRIWPQFRLHSNIFTARALALMTVNWYEAHYMEQKQQPNYIFNLVIVFATLVSADVANMWTDTRYQSNSVRDLRTSPHWKMFFSLMQFHATSTALLGLRRNSSLFMTVVVMQLTAFLGTLQRKNLISHEQWVLGYGAMVIWGTAVGSYEHTVHAGARGAAAFMGNCAALWRMGAGGGYNIDPSKKKLLLLTKLIHSKYVVWTGMYLILHFLVRPTLEAEQEGAPKCLWIPVSAVLSTVAVGWKWMRRSDDRKDHHVSKVSNGDTQTKKKN